MLTFITPCKLTKLASKLASPLLPFDDAKKTQRHRGKFYPVKSSIALARPRRHPSVWILGSHSVYIRVRVSARDSLKARHCAELYLWKGGNWGDDFKENEICTQRSQANHVPRARTEWETQQKAMRKQQEAMNDFVAMWEGNFISPPQHTMRKFTFFPSFLFP